jgi:hypothetical protein
LILPLARPEQERRPAFDGLIVWEAEPLIAGRALRVFCPGKVHAITVGVFPVMLPDQVGVSLPASGVLLRALVRPGQVIRLDVSPGTFGGDPPFVVIEPIPTKTWGEAGQEGGRRARRRRRRARTIIIR